MRSHVNETNSTSWVKIPKIRIYVNRLLSSKCGVYLSSFWSLVLVFMSPHLRALPLHPHIHPPRAFLISFFSASAYECMNDKSMWVTAEVCGRKLSERSSHAAVEVERRPSLWFIEKQLAHKNPSSLACKHLVWRHPLVWITEGNYFHHFHIVASTWCSGWTGVRINLTVWAPFIPIWAGTYPDVLDKMFWNWREKKVVLNEHSWKK